MGTFLIAFMIRRQRMRQDWMMIMHKISTGKIHHVCIVRPVSPYSTNGIPPTILGYS